jgi:hypothetical protein
MSKWAGTHPKQHETAPKAHFKPNPKHTPIQKQNPQSKQPKILINAEKNSQLTLPAEIKRNKTPFTTLSNIEHLLTIHKPHINWPRC